MYSFKYLVTYVFSIASVFANIKEVEELVNIWAPLIWLAPEEKYFPNNVDDFLKHVYLANEYGEKMTKGREASPKNTLYLKTKIDVEALRNNPNSFLYGSNPSQLPVPVYAIVTLCTPFELFEALNTNLNDVKDARENYLNFYVSYWIFFPYNKGKEACFIGKIPAPFLFNTCLGKRKFMGNHVGDWEHVSLYFQGQRHPKNMYLSTHDFGVYYVYDPLKNVFNFSSQTSTKRIGQRPKFPKQVKLQNSRPILFAAQGSHGLWATPGDHVYLNIPKLIDKTGFGFAWKTWNDLRIFHMGRSVLPAWMTFKGRWGNPKDKCLLFTKFGLCEDSDGPMGLLTRNPDFSC